MVPNKIIKILIGTTALAFSIATPAADKVNWTGAYVGVHLGDTWETGKLSLVNDDNNNNSFNPNYTSSNNFSGGFLAGYNFQINNDWLVGIEGDIDLGQHNKSTVNSGKIPNSLYSPNNLEVDDVSGHIRARLGYLKDSFLIYISPGVAVKRERVDVPYYYCEGDYYVGTTSANKTLWGVSLGGGAEYAVNSNFKVRAEYLYDHYGNTTYSMTNTYTDRSVSSENKTLRAAITYTF